MKQVEDFETLFVSFTFINSQTQSYFLLSVYKPNEVCVCCFANRE